jgi:replicative DNA helicase
MTSSLEKVFFNYILNNKKYFEVVKPYFFKNSEIQTVYNVIRQYILLNSDAEKPSPRQIFEMVSLEDKEGLITKEILKSILTINMQEYDEKNFIEPRFNAWVLSKRIQAGAIDIMDETRNIENIHEFDKIVDLSSKIRKMADDMSSVNFIEDDDMGSDFDDVESHVQDNSVLKVKSGFETVDHILGGGWDISTLNCLMAETNGGKSLWMQNFAVKSADLGYNVLYVTLEMSEKKVMKRLGAMRLRVPINDYDQVSKNTELIQAKIKNIGGIKKGGDLFDRKVGKIFTKFWAAGTAQVSDIDHYIEKLQQRKGLKIDLVIVDYITLIASPKGIGGDSLYIKGKHLAEGLRAMGAKYKFPVITSVQVAKDAWGASDITLESVPESKAIAETCDTFFAIIRTEEMKRQNKYRFKLLKQRDGDFTRSQIHLELNPTFLILENDRFLDA